MDFLLKDQIVNTVNDGSIIIRHSKVIVHLFDNGHSNLLSLLRYTPFHFSINSARQSAKIKKTNGAWQDKYSAKC